MSKDIDELYIPEGKEKDGFEDPTGSYLHNSFYNKSSTSHAARGIKRNDVYIGGGHPKVNLELNEPSPSEYPYNKVTETLSGHSIEYDDTPASERILIKHRLGSGIELRNDGTVIISSKKNTIRLSQGDEKVIIEGNGDIVYNGNLNLTVSGDMNLDVGGIPISKFIGPYGDKAKFNKLTNQNKLQVARNLYLHAEILREYNLDPRYRLVIAEGLYTKENSETLTPGGIKDLATQGRAVVYEVRDNNGNISNHFTFTLATTLKDYINYDKLILDYDSFDGTLNSQIIILTPNVNSDFKLSYKNQLETKLNGRVQGSNEIIHMEIS